MTKLSMSNVVDRKNNLLHRSILETYTVNCEDALRDINAKLSRNALIYVSEAASSSDSKFFNSINQIVRILEAGEQKLDAREYERLKNKVSSVLETNVNSDNLNTLKQKLDSSQCKSIDNIKDTIDHCLELDRILDNHSIIAGKFDMDSVFDGHTDAYHSVIECCENIDRFKKSINQKYRIALEECLFLLEQSPLGKDKQNAKIVAEAVTDYFLANNKYIPDKKFSKIKNILECCEYLDKDIRDEVSSVFVNNTPYSEKILALVDKVDPSSAKDFKRLDAAELLDTYIDTIKESTKLTGVQESILRLGIAKAYCEAATIKEQKSITSKLIKKVNSESSKIMSEIRGLTSSLVMIDENSFDPFISESMAAMIDQAIIDNGVNTDKSIITEDPEYISILSRINDVDFNQLLTESKDFADSNDVKDIIDKYKAEQIKNEKTFERVFKKFYTVSPDKIIDDIPNFLHFVNVFGIVATSAIPVVGLPLSLLLTFVNYLVRLHLRREEAEKACKYFNAEQKKVEKQLDKMSSSGKEDSEKYKRLDEYNKCLEKCIDKLETYRDNLYSEKELEMRDALDEATTISLADTITMEEYKKEVHPVLVKELERSSHLIKSQLITRLILGDIEEYELIDGQSVSETLSNESDVETLILNSFISPDGMVSIPLYKINISDCKCNDAFLEIVDVCTYVNRYTSNLFMVSTNMVDGYVYVTFNYLKCIAISNLRHHTMHIEVKEGCTNILKAAYILEQIIDINPNEVISYIKENMNELNEYKDSIYTLLDLSEDDDEDSLRDHNITATGDPNEYNPIALDDHHDTDSISSDCCEESYMEKAEMQLEAMEILRDIVTEAKTKVKNNDIKKRADKLASKSKNKQKQITKGVKKMSRSANVSMKTNAKLTGEVIKNKARDLSSKEKEASKTIDAVTSSLKKNIENALVSDRREAIIKGSIIPSFSKMIKTALAFGVTYAINPVVATIGALGALACSKKLTEKEKWLILDEIDIELKVVEKELEGAEREGSSKKYRQLLQYQRKLQRESQRIRWDLKKDIPDPKF